MKSTPLSLIAGTVALAAVTGFAALTAPGEAGAPEAKAAARLPVERTSLLCPSPGGVELAETTYTSLTPAGEGGGEAGTAELKPAAPVTDDDAKDDDKKDGKDGKGDKADAKKDAKKEKPVVTLKESGKPVTAETSDEDAPALIGTATGRLAPGWAAQQTTVSPRAAPGPARPQLRRAGHRLLVPRREHGQDAAGLHPPHQPGRLRPRRGHRAVRPGGPSRPTSVTASPSRAGPVFRCCSPR